VALRRVLALVAVVLATLAGALGALAIFSVDRDLSVGTIRLSTDPGHDGALDIYVPLVDWGVRFEAVRFPARLSIDVRTVDRKAVARVAEGRPPDVDAVREEAEDAIASYIRLLLAVVLGVALGAGTLVALALRARAAPLGWLLPAVGGSALAAVLVLYLLLPPRGTITEPEYYANGPDIPVALRAIESATESAETISEELNDQLVGLARLVSLPAERARTEPLPRLTLASDLHNNLLALPTLERAVRGGPLLFAGDLTSAGSPYEARLTRRFVRVGRPFVFVSGNHDSDSLARRLARAGAIVLTQRGRLLPDGRRGPVVVKVGGLRLAGYSDPFERRRAERFRRRGTPQPGAAQKREFVNWLRPLLGRIDLVMVHSPMLTEVAVQELRRSPPPAPVAILTGHTHVSHLRTSTNLLELNGGTAGGGGTGNLEKNQPFGLAVLTYEHRRGFAPVAADLVEIDARSGSAKAERVRLNLDGRGRVGADAEDR
jgi:predicted phosphodiesterase